MLRQYLFHRQTTHASSFIKPLSLMKDELYLACLKSRKTCTKVIQDLTFILVRLRCQYPVFNFWEPSVFKCPYDIFLYQKPTYVHISVGRTWREGYNKMSSLVLGSFSYLFFLFYLQIIFTSNDSLHYCAFKVFMFTHLNSDQIRNGSPRYYNIDEE